MHYNKYSRKDNGQKQCGRVTAIVLVGKKGHAAWMNVPQNHDFSLAFRQNLYCRRGFRRYLPVKIQQHFFGKSESQKWVEVVKNV